MATSTFEEYHTAEWLREQVEAIASPNALQFYLELIPEDVALPAVRASVQDRQDIRGIGDERERILTRLDWLVVVVKEGHLVAPLIPYVVALDNALHNKTGSTSTIEVLSCVRIESFSLLEPEESGVQYRHAGGLYRTMVQAP
jgi:hypothetical protein